MKHFHFYLQWLHGLLACAILTIGRRPAGLLRSRQTGGRTAGALGASAPVPHRHDEFLQTEHGQQLLRECYPDPYERESRFNLAEAS